MKKYLRIGLIVLVAVCVALVLYSRCDGCGGCDGCCEGGFDETKKYVIFENIYGNEKYRVSYPGTRTEEYEYDENKEYYFYYTAYYTDNDMSTGERGKYFTVIRANKPGTYHVTAQINIDVKYKDYVLKVVIKEKPDLRVDPQVRFDPNGATVEERDGETVYVYKYDSWKNNIYPLPILELYYNEIKIESPTSTEFGSDRYVQGSIEVNTGKRVGLPTQIGLYRVHYRFSDYIEKEKDKYYPVSVYILVEIQE